MGWFFGFKLHLIVNDKGDLVSWTLTKGHVKGKLFADKNYISQPLFKELFEKRTHLITNLRFNMKNRLLPIMDPIMLKKTIYY